MPLYAWKSRYLENYAPGRIIVVADNEDGGRKTAREEFERHFAERYGYLGSFGEDDVLGEEAARLRATFEADIQAAPEIVSSGVIFVSGSE